MGFETNQTRHNSEAVCLTKGREQDGRDGGRFGFYEIAEEDNEAMECNLQGCPNKNGCLTCAAAWCEREIYKAVRDNLKVLEEVLTTNLEGKFRLEQGATNWKEVAKIAGIFWHEKKKPERHWQRWENRC